MMGLKERNCGTGRWLKLAPCRVQWRALLLEVLCFQVLLLLVIVSGIRDYMLTKEGSKHVG
jgi:hypothetical protein